MWHVGHTTIQQVEVNEEKDSEFADQINLPIDGGQCQNRNSNGNGKRRESKKG